MTKKPIPKKPGPKTPGPKKPSPQKKIEKPIHVDDGLIRCTWPGQDPLYVAYHDQEWGVPEYDDRALYEKLMLDGFQAGLSWITILRKRENFRRAFDGFEPAKIARYTPNKIERLMQDAGIVRNRQKIEGAVLSARAWLDIMEKGPGFSRLLWDYLDGRPQINKMSSTKQVPAETELSRTISKDLAKRGFKFCGPTIVYAFMQAVGMVNDHLVTCHRHAACAALAKHAR
jgi:DNA-3-methyladenine glycosylase I